MNDDDSRLTFCESAEFPSKNLLDHLKGVVSRPIELGIAFASVLSIVWLLFEILNRLFDVEPSGITPLLLMCAVAALVAFGWRVLQYRDECPEGLESVSKDARKTAHLQPRKWESKLALQLLSERILPLERECARVLDKKEFVITKRVDDPVKYFDWVNGRSENYKEMVILTNHLLVKEFVPSIVSTSMLRACPLKILGAVEALQRLCSQAIDIERETRSIIPPPHLERLHEMQLGWTNPSRDAIRQLYQVLEKIQSYDIKSNLPLHLSIEFVGPANVDEYLQECDEHILALKTDSLCESEDASS